MKKIYAFALSVLALGISSCEDEPYEQQLIDFKTSEAYSFMPMQEGSYWVYDVEYINADGTPYDGNDPLYANSTDSVYVSASGYHMGREAFFAENHNIQSGAIENIVYAFVGNSLYVYIDPLAGSASGVTYGPSGWTEVFDLDYDTKTIASQNLSTKDERNPAAPYLEGSYSYSYEIYGTDMKEVFEGEGKIEVMEIGYTTDLDIWQHVPTFPSVQRTTSSTDITRLGKNIGPVYSETSTATSGFLTNEDQGDKPIRVSRLVRYKL